MLSDFIQEYRHRHFVWGETDCCQFAAAWLARCTGRELSLLVGPYASERGARRAIRKAGFTGLESLVNAHLGAPAAPLNLRRGDIGLVSTDDGPALGIVGGAVVWVMAPDGVANLPASALLKGWRIMEQMPCLR
ncbi:DUF6950 family protein [Ferrimonas balearica]|uniref:DUF6950 family protein n=1 Tax=Ferrimonas balearica TaxID=44012 RepID=UPI001C951167|nr:hypothetical protein [Ferrimonas balearica]MBY6223552.1 hypothetical protein [Ferrimonas balearica]